MAHKSSKKDTWVTLMTIGAKTGCHQRADRSFFINNCQFPICARCTGVHIGYIIAIILTFFCHPPIWFCIAFCGIMFIDWLVQFLKIKESNNIRRLVTGIIGGYGLLSFEINVILLIINKFVEGKL